MVLISGVVFALQGLRLLPSAVMHGRPEWVVIGTLMAAAALALLWKIRR